MAFSAALTLFGGFTFVVAGALLFALVGIEGQSVTSPPAYIPPVASRTPAILLARPHAGTNCPSARV
jgi:hypothetical protein